MRHIEEYSNLNYRFSLHRDEEGNYFAEVDEFPGCIADGSSPNEAMGNLREAMKSWVTSRIEAGLEVPEPRDTTNYSGRILVRLPRSLHKNLSEQASSEGISLNQHIVSALSEHFGRTEVLRAQAPTYPSTPYSNFVLGTVKYANVALWDRHGYTAAWSNEPAQNNMFCGSLANPLQGTVGCIDVQVGSQATTRRKQVA